jgi:hypothetical protein
VLIWFPDPAPMYAGLKSIFRQTERLFPNHISESLQNSIEYPEPECLLQNGICPAEFSHGQRTFSAVVTAMPIQSFLFLPQAQSGIL